MTTAPRTVALTAVMALLAALAAPARAGDLLQDCPDCPALVAVSPGSFLMGSTASDPDRAKDGREEPAREVRVVRGFALGRFEVSVGEFGRFVAATGHITDAERDPATGCLAWLADDHRLAPRAGLHWRQPGYAQTPQHPVVCVSWNDAQAYVRWLATLTGRPYRLASEAEWEYAARAGTATRWPWGDDVQDPRACTQANIADLTPATDGFTWTERHACRDGHFHAAPVGSLAANALGLHDLVGNVWEWVQDCYETRAYDDPATPRDGSARQTTACSARGLRGGAWISGPARTRPAYRGGYAADTRSNVFGLRVARDL